jgi:acetate---CoA ligase (ADP-forming)
LTPVKNQGETRSAIERLLKPRSIALVGASASPGSLGESVLLNLERMQYAGDLHLINPNRAAIHNRPCLPSIDALPMDVDCAVLAIPFSAVVESARACVRKGVGSLIVYASGFAESSEEGKAAQRELSRLAIEHNTVIVGPNCLGVVNYVDSVPLTFVVTPPQPAAHRPGVAIISQSGALAAVLAVNMRHHGIPLTYSISTGNEAAFGVEDAIESLIGDRSTRVIALVVEQFRGAKRLLRLAERVRAAGQYIVLLHPGSSHAARASAVTHTGAIAGNYQVMRTLVARAGIVHVESLEELVDVSQILTLCGLLPCGGVALFTESGAFKALALDLCERIGLDLPAFSGRGHQQMRDALPSFIPVTNPMDLTAQGLVDPTLYSRTLPPILEDDSFGSVLMSIILTDPTTTGHKLPHILDALRSLKPSKPIVFAAMDEGAPLGDEYTSALRQLGVACFPSPERALRALGHVTRLARQEPASDPIESSAAIEIPVTYGTLPEYRSKQILTDLGIRVPEGSIARNVDEALAIACKITFPVALKAQAASLAHKSDVGGVILNVPDEAVLREKWEELHQRLAINCPGIALDGVLVERMAPKGVELILGSRNDPDWGPVLLAGFGGVLAEAIKDVRILPTDLRREEIIAELGKLQCAPLLRGFRGLLPLDVSAVADILMSLGRLMRSCSQIQEIDINPVVVYSQNSGAIALDAVIVADAGVALPVQL